MYITPCRRIGSRVSAVAAIENGECRRLIATISQQRFLGQRLEALADSVCGGSFTPMLTQLLRGRRLRADERDALQELVSELSAEKNDKKTRKKKKR